MPARERSVTATIQGGTTGRFVSSPDLSAGDAVFASSSFCGDIVGSGDNAPFHVHREEWSGGIINKPYTGFFSSYFNNYCCDMRRGPVPDHLGTDSPTSSAAATMAAGRTNPSRPYIDIPVEVLQLPEIVSLIRKRGAGIIRQLGNANLELQFGILPVAEDLDKLMQFGAQIDRRVGELTRLRSQRGLRRTIGIGSYSATAVQNYFMQSQNLLLRENFNVSTSEVVRVHTRWMPDDVSQLASNPAMRALATRAVLGLTFDASSAWELIPWSWLFDYFSTTSEWFAANRNVVGATLSDVSVMRHTVTEGSTPGITGSDFTFSSLSWKREDKRRDTSFISMNAGLNLLSENQLGIVASIAVTR